MENEFIPGKWYKIGCMEIYIKFISREVKDGKDFIFFTEMVKCEPNGSTSYQKKYNYWINNDHFWGNRIHKTPVDSDTLLWILPFDHPDRTNSFYEIY